MIIAKIDVSKIDKEKLYKGEKGTYLDIILMETPDSKYGDDYMVTQGVSKEDREAGIKGAILGNAKTFVSKGVASQGAGKPKSNAKEEDEDKSLPF